MNKRGFIYFILVPLLVVILFIHEQPERTDMNIVNIQTVQPGQEILNVYHWQDDDDYLYMSSSNRKAGIRMFTAKIYASATPLLFLNELSVITPYENKQTSLSVLCVYRI